MNWMYLFSQVWSFAVPSWFSNVQNLHWILYCYQSFTRPLLLYKIQKLPEISAVIDNGWTTNISAIQWKKYASHFKTKA